MLVRVLGSAAGGGVPQWNCGCEYCIAAVCDPALARTGCSVAVSADGSTWTVVNAAADLPGQLTCFPALRPPKGTRETPFAQLVLTDAELDHILGLLMLRQAAALTVAATPGVRSLLDGALRLLGGYLSVAWREITPGRGFPLDPSCPDGLRGQAIPVGSGKPPAHAGPDPVPADAVVGLRVSDPRGGSLVYAPCVPALTGPLLDACRTASLVLLDGTFFTDDELARAGKPRTARQLGHLPVSGPDGSLAQLEPSIRAKVVYTHLNNTNPLLAGDSAAAEQVRRAGAAVAADGAEYEL
ncbi:MAG TPA: MBL fold metallo-hydrolase [Streptosporangiaceae bacterium]|jgi:pyrroloquinoline quinone biosynthesis protein B|nr:MBL fold metallo-hydrolase [Streptosporangiaceae bacterium]